jgi:putative solute:sodium symporter small subunit
MDKSGQAYWYAVLKLMAIILGVWFIAGYVFGIILAPALNNIHLGGYPLGFWFAHQGSIYIYVALIFIYAKLQGNLDKKFDVHEN